MWSKERAFTTTEDDLFVFSRWFMSFFFGEPQKNIIFATKKCEPK